ncbi:STAS domain-containing protein [Rhabdothermincola sediminis]|uniref:STAS domain-containing protein n=1 Tax=Rhabdothermincola sediminis TaxID=2751370 RepID=UPI001AA08313
MERDPVVHVVRAPENLDASTVPVFGRRLEEIPEGAAVDVDLAGVEFIDSSGLRLLLMETARREGAASPARHLPTRRPTARTDGAPGPRQRVSRGVSPNHPAREDAACRPASAGTRRWPRWWPERSP